MPFIDPAEAAALQEKLSADPSGLGKLYKAKKSEYMVRSVDHSLADDLIADGWEEFGKPLKTKTKLRKRKDHDRQFEDDIWCQMYDLGYRHLNIDRNFKLPFGPNPTDKKQIDVVAANDDTILIIECKSSARSKKAPSFKTEFEALNQRLYGHSKALDQLFGKGRRVKYIFATRNLRLARESADIKRLEAAKGFFYNDNTYDYVERLVRTYRSAAHYQFMGLMFKGQNINKERIEVPAIEGRMGAKTYYMFSIEPALLLKLGFVLHRTRANESEMPTYQRLLVPSRLKGITKFIDGGGYFPNSAIVNFSERDAKLEFQAHKRGEDTGSRTGILKIPNAYGIAYIIDGQHRIYGYANSEFKDTNTIPVVALVGLAASEQLELFMDINQNQKAVSPTLRITLEEDLFWNSPRLDSRMKALRSSIIRQLGGDQSGPLYSKISLGEDKAVLQAKPFADALLRCGLLPEAKGNKFADGTTECALYDTSNTEHENEMLTTRARVVSFINACYEAAEEALESDTATLGEFVLSNRGTYAFISLLGSLHKFEIEAENLSIKSSAEDRLDAVRRYLNALFAQLKNLDKEQTARLTGKLGSGAETIWLRTFQTYVNAKFPTYDPPELQDWKERQDKQLQDKGRELGTEIERHTKSFVINQLQTLFGDDWDLEIGSIKRRCEDLAGEEMEKAYKEGLERRDIHWTEMFMINQYKTIIEKYWTRRPDEPEGGFETFEEHFAINIGYGFNSKAEKLKWLSMFNTLRNNWAHEGTKEKGLNRKEVELIVEIHRALGLST